MNDKNKNYNEILTLPNVITTTRIISSILLFSFMLTTGISLSPVLALVTALIGATDFVDGYLAREKNMTSKIGKVLDPIADKVYNWGLCFTLMATGAMPLWPMLILGRDVVASSFYSYQAKIKKRKDLAPTFPAKAKMAFQTMGVISTIAFGFGGSLLGMIAPVSMSLAIATVVPEIFAIKKKYLTKKESNDYYEPETREFQQPIIQENRHDTLKKEKTLTYRPEILNVNAKERVKVKKFNKLN